MGLTPMRTQSCLLQCTSSKGKIFPFFNIKFECPERLVELYGFVLTPNILSKLTILINMFNYILPTFSQLIMCCFDLKLEFLKVNIH